MIADAALFHPVYELNAEAGLLSQLFGLKALKYTKYSCGFQTSICGEISR